MATQPRDLALVDDADSAQPELTYERIQEAVEPIINDLNALVTEAITLRKPTEERWLKDLRQFHGIYEAKIANILTADDSRSAIFINITRPKTNAWSARIGDMLFPNDEKNWGINPTPVPELTNQARDAIKKAEELEAQVEQQAEQVNAEAESGVPISENVDRIDQSQQLANEAFDYRMIEKRLNAEIDEAARRCTLMEREIDDQFTEANYPAKCRAVIDDMTKVGVGILKGPITRKNSKRQWISRELEGGSTAFELKARGGVSQTYRRVSYWHFFPDPSAETIEDAEYTFERHLPNKKLLRKMAAELGFYPEGVRQLLRDGPRYAGASGTDDLGFLAQLRAIDESASSISIDMLKDRYVVWEFHGSLEIEQIAKMIRATGRYEDADRFEKEADELNAARMVRVFFCNRILLSIEEEYLLDSGDSLYSVATFEKSESSILGAVGVPHLMQHEQSMLNSAVRMMMDNAGLAVGPQIVIDKLLIEPEDGTWQLKPRKVWQWTEKPGAQQRERPFETFDIPMNQEMLAAIVQMAMRFVDEAVSMPLIAQGEQGEHTTQTRGGMSMLMNAAGTVLRRVIKHWDDDLTAPTVRRAYDFNMQFSDKDEIKGDMAVEARGTSVLLVRELQSEQLLALLQQFATHPILGVAFKAYHTMRLLLQAMSINPNDVLIPEDEYMAKLKEMAEAGGEESPDAIRANASIEVAKIDADSRKATAESNERVAEMRANTAFAELGMRENLSLTQIQAMFDGKKLDAAVKLQSKKMDNDSKERGLAAEIAVERENKREAEARGLTPTGSGGAISMGGERV